MSSISKASEVVVKNQIQSYLIGNNLLSTFQSGFRKYHSTTSALLKCVWNMSNKELTCLTLLDFSKAFDSLNHKILFNKLISKFNFKFCFEIDFWLPIKSFSGCVFKQHFFKFPSNFFRCTAGFCLGAVIIFYVY